MIRRAVNTPTNLEMVECTPEEMNDALPVFVVREIGDTHELFSSYSYREAGREFDQACVMRRRYGCDRVAS